MTLSRNDSRARGVTVLAVGLSAAVMTLDTTVVNVALNAIGTEFDATLSGLQWVVNGYTLAFAALLLSAGSLSDRLGRRGVFVLGMSVFTLASLACALAPSEGVLIASRIVQGAGASLVMGTGLALIAGAFQGEDPKKRQTAIGVFTAMGAAAAALGPLIGGALVDGAGWRFIFVINIPLGILIVVAALLAVRPQPKSPGSRLDLLGALLAVLMLFALNYGLLTGANDTWSRVDVIASLIAAPVLLVVFLVVEHRLGDRAMLDLSLFRIPTFSGAIVLSFAARLASFGLFPFLILWLTGLLGHTPLQVGLILLVMSAAMLVVAPLSGQLTRIAPVRVLTCVGMVVVGLGLLWGAAAVRADGDWTAILPCLILLGVGSGIVMPHMMGLAVGVVPAERAGMASGVSNAFFPLGTAVGVAVYGAVMTAVIAGRVPDAEAARAVAAGRIGEIAARLPSGADAFVRTAREAFVSGLSEVLLIAGVAAVASGIATLFLVRAKDVHTAPAAEPIPAPAQT